MIFVKTNWLIQRIKQVTLNVLIIILKESELNTIDLIQKINVKPLKNPLQTFRCYSENME